MATPGRAETTTTATSDGFTINELSTNELSTEPVEMPPHRQGQGNAPRAMVQLTLEARGKGPLNDLSAALSDIERVEAVLTAPSYDAAE